jgi:hypothetical protein
VFVVSSCVREDNEWAVTCRITGRGLVPGLGDSRGVPCLGVVTLTELETVWD